MGGMYSDLIPNRAQPFELSSHYVPDSRHRLYMALHRLTKIPHRVRHKSRLRPRHGVLLCCRHVGSIKT